jgi:OOP family OmpA-OmpF porin
MKLGIAVLLVAGALAQAPQTANHPAIWSAKTERTVNGPEADLLVRTGDINNLGFGWPQGFDPFSGQSTPAHAYPWKPPAGEPAGTDRIMLGSVVTARDVDTRPGDGYSHVPRAETMPQPITLTLGALPANIHAVLFQMFLDDFQAPVWHSHFQVSLNGTRIPSFESAVNALVQTGPIGKLVSLRLLPEYWPLLRSGTVKLFIDDPTTHAPDGYAVDFVRILVNPHPSRYAVSIAGSVMDADANKPISGATVTAALASAATDAAGRCTLKGLPAGMVVVTAAAPGYEEATIPVDVAAGQTGHADFRLHRHRENTADLARAVAETGSANVYGLHFDVGSAKLRPDSAPALQSILGLIQSRPGSHWTIAGHTDNQGAAAYNQKLSEARAASVVAWLTAHGVAATRLAPRGFGFTRPVADNSTESGRALNRRVEIAPAQ